MDEDIRCSFCGQDIHNHCNSHDDALGCSLFKLPAKASVKSTGGSTSYYAIPKGATDLADLIEHKQMSFNLGNIFKACYRLGEKSGNDKLYDINKIIYFAERLKALEERKG